MAVVDAQAPVLSEDGRQKVIQQIYTEQDRSTQGVRRAALAAWCIAAVGVGLTLVFPPVAVPAGVFLAKVAGAVAVGKSASHFINFLSLEKLKEKSMDASFAQAVANRDRDFHKRTEGADDLVRTGLGIAVGAWLVGFLVPPLLPATQFVNYFVLGGLAPFAFGWVAKAECARSAENIHNAAIAVAAQEKRAAGANVNQGAPAFGNTPSAKAAFDATNNSAPSAQKVSPAPKPSGLNL
jgi:hypothetical protein